MQLCPRRLVRLSLVLHLRARLFLEEHSPHFSGSEPQAILTSSACSALVSSWASFELRLQALELLIPVIDPGRQCGIVTAQLGILRTPFSTVAWACCGLFPSPQSLLQFIDTGLQPADLTQGFIALASGCCNSGLRFPGERYPR